MTDKEKLEILKRVKEAGIQDKKYNCPGWELDSKWECCDCQTLFPRLIVGLELPCPCKLYTLTHVTRTLNKEIARLEKAVKEVNNES
jgi:hypothetical protein